jgi:hypothetical protein
MMIRDYRGGKMYLVPNDQIRALSKAIRTCETRNALNIIEEIREQDIGWFDNYLSEMIKKIRIALSNGKCVHCETILNKSDPNNKEAFRYLGDEGILICDNCAETYNKDKDDSLKLKRE